MRIPTQSVVGNQYSLPVGKSHRYLVVETGTHRMHYALRTVHRHESLQLRQIYICSRSGIEVASEIKLLTAPKDVHGQPLAGIKSRIAKQKLVVGNAHPESTTPVSDESHLPSAHHLI